MKQLKIFLLSAVICLTFLIHSTNSYPLQPTSTVVEATRTPLRGETGQLPFDEVRRKHYHHSHVSVFPGPVEAINIDDLPRESRHIRHRVIRAPVVPRLDPAVQEAINNSCLKKAKSVRCLKGHKHYERGNKGKIVQPHILRTNYDLHSSSIFDSINPEGIKRPVLPKRLHGRHLSRKAKMHKKQRLVRFDPGRPSQRHFGGSHHRAHDLEEIHVHRLH